MPFCPPVEAMHAVTIMSLKAIIIIISIRTKSTNTEKQLTQRYGLQFSSLQFARINVVLSAKHFRTTTMMIYML